MKEIALDLSNNDYRLSSKENGCFSSSNVFLKKYRFIDGVLCAVDANDAVLCTYRKTTFSEVASLFNLDTSLDNEDKGLVLIKVENGQDVQPYVYYSAEETGLSKFTSFLTETESANLTGFLARLPTLDNLRKIIYSKKSTGNWIYLEFNQDINI